MNDIQENIRSERPKSAYVCFCKECGEDIFIMCHEESGTMYCRCLECGTLFPNVELAIQYFLGDKKFYEMDLDTELDTLVRLYSYSKNDRFATRQEIADKGWDIPKNKVTICPECWMVYQKCGFVRIKKETRSQKLFCRCDECGSIWWDIRDPLTLIPMEYIEEYGSRTVRPDSDSIDGEEEASREDIIASSWDVYDDIMYIERLPDKS